MIMPSLINNNQITIFDIIPEQEKQEYEIMNWLEKNYNKNQLLYFKCKKDYIVSYFKKTNEQFTTYNIDHILKQIEIDKKYEGG